MAMTRGGAHPRHAATSATASAAASGIAVISRYPTIGGRLSPTPTACSCCAPGLHAVFVSSLSARESVDVPRAVWHANLKESYGAAETLVSPATREHPCPAAGADAMPSARAGAGSGTFAPIRSG